jgi:hypothetical protein
LKHDDHPYPDEEQKRLLCELTKLSREQLDHWFINARRRFLKEKPSAPKGNGNSSTAPSAKEESNNSSKKKPAKTSPVKSGTS